MQLALFDLDHTLLDLDSDHAWGEFLVRHGLVDADSHRAKNDQFYQDYQRGELDAVAYNEFVLEFLSRHEPTHLHALHQQFMDEVIVPAMRPKGFAAIARHREAGHEIVVITATNAFITAPIVQAFGVSNLIATQPAMRDGRYTGKLATEPCYRDAKLRLLHLWLAGRTVTESWGYSDSFNDLPLLEWVDHPVAVCPDARLHAAALDRHWPVQDWRLHAG